MKAVVALPPTIRVKLSSEAAESIALTPVVVRELPLAELIEHMLGVTGKNEARIREILQRGTLVSGGSRFRWTGLETDPGSLRELLAVFPDADPERRFAAARCIRATLRGGRQAIEIPREAAGGKSLFQRKSFWDALMEVVGGDGFEYSGYSYRDRADRFLRALTTAETGRLRQAAAVVRYSTLRAQIAAGAYTQAEFLVVR